jgi:hypothetical protein
MFIEKSWSILPLQRSGMYRHKSNTFLNIRADDVFYVIGSNLSDLSEMI